VLYNNGGTIIAGTIYKVNADGTVNLAQRIAPALATTLTSDLLT